jgi:hypothetical protein
MKILYTTISTTTKYYYQDELVSTTNSVVLYERPAVNTLTSTLAGISRPASIEIYPNPMTSGHNLSVTLPRQHHSGEYTIKISSSNGEQVLSMVLSQDGMLNPQELKTGFYILTATNGGQSYTQKLMVR